MGATVSVINEEMARPLDGADIQPTSSVQMADVKRLRELLHVVYKDEDDIDDSALTPSLALEIDALMSKCANEPGLGRLANDELLRQLLMERVEELSPSEREAHNNTLQNNNNDESKTDEPKKKKKLDIASLARLHAQKTRLGNVQNTTSNKVNADEAVTPIASSNSSNFNPLQFPDHLPEGGGGSGSDSLNNALTPTGSHAHHHLHRSPSSNSNRLPMVVEKQYSFTEDNLMDSISSSKSRLSMNKSGSMNEADLEEEAAALIASYKKREEESKDMLNNGSLELMEELAELPMATLPSQQTAEYLKQQQQQQQQQQAQLQDKTQAEPTVMKGRSRPALLTFDIQDDNTAAAAATTPQAVTGGGGGRRRKKMSLALTLDPENDLTSSTPMKEDSPKRNNNPGLELNIFGGGNEDTSAQLHAHHHHHASHHQLQNGHGGGQGGSAQGQGGNPNYNISEDVDGCQLSKSGTLMVDDFRISVDGIVESPTGQFGATAPGFNNLNGLNITDAKSPNSVGTENGSLGDFDGSMQNVDPSLRRPSKMKRRPSLNKSSHAGATGEPFLELQRLGAGASGTVVKALHVETLRLVAIKTLPIYDAAKRHQMICELKLLYRWQMESITLPIHHNQSSMEAGQNALSGNDSDDDEDTNKKEEKKEEEEEEEETLVSHCYEIVSFHEAFISPASGSVSLVVEYMNGGSLQDLADQGGCSDEAFLASVANHTLRGLKFLHTSKPPKIHRDIKPANILINTRGECKIADFGIYREMDATGSANAHTFIGSLSFMSPERIRGDEYGCPADVWSIGLTLMTVALGRCPVTDNGRGYWALLHELTDKPPPTLPDDMPFTPLIRDFLSKLLTAEPKERWSAKKLLTHPFMSEHGYFETSDFYIPSSIPHTNTSSGNSAYMDHDGNYNISDLQWSELNQVIDKLAKRTTDILSSNLYNYSNPEPLPKISDEKLIRFSEQIDMPKALVKEAFEKKFNGNDLPKLLV